jgi:hypothetical protein
LRVSSSGSPGPPPTRKTLPEIVFPFIVESVRPFG